MIPAFPGIMASFYYRRGGGRKSLPSGERRPAGEQEGKIPLLLDLANLACILLPGTDSWKMNMRPSYRPWPTLEPKKPPPG